MIYLYNIIVHLVLLAALPVLPVMVLFSVKRRRTLLQRFGITGRLQPKKAGEKRIWVHALSVGEVTSALPFVRALKAAYPDLSVIFTASTQTGYDTACRYLMTQPVLVDQIGYFPFDIPFCIHKKIQQIHPDRVCIVETDLWPNFLHLLGRKKIPVLLLNARLSERSLKGYSRFRSFFAMIFSSLFLIFVQTLKDKERFETLGIPPEKIEITGNVKFDQPPLVFEPHVAEKLSNLMKLAPGAPVIIAGSTHDGEEKILAAAFAQLKLSHPSLKMIIAPRNPGRAAGLTSLPGLKDQAPVLFSNMTPDSPGSDVILIDVMGILAGLYVFADIVFIGGSLVPLGGHNPLEAAALSRPVVFGPHMTDFTWVSEELVQWGAARRVSSQGDLIDQLQGLLQDAPARQAMAKNARSFYLENKGAVEKCLERMEATHFI